MQPEQVYVGLWSHAGRVRVHIHFVVQPATTEAIDAVGSHGPGLAAGMFERGELPDPAAVEAISDRARGVRSLSPVRARLPDASAMTEAGCFGAAVGRSSRIAAGPRRSRILSGFLGFSVDFRTLVR